MLALIAFTDVAVERLHDVVGVNSCRADAIQLFVCADRRYGPTYNIGTAREIMRCLQRNGYQIGSGVPVTLIGWSGGAQIAIGACAWPVASCPSWPSCPRCAW